MTKTTNYQLNQWAKSDRVMMDDFNADNAKIDAALKAAAEASPYVKLLSVTLDTQCSHWSIDVSGIDLRNYRKLEIYPRLKGDTDQWPTLYTNNANSMGDVPLNNDPSRQNFGFMYFTLYLEMPRIYPFRDGQRVNTTNQQKPYRDDFVHPALANGVYHLNTLNFRFSQDYHLLPGSQVTIYGMKM